jgi:hypothetical protein
MDDDFYRHTTEIMKAGPYGLQRLQLTAKMKETVPFDRVESIKISGCITNPPTDADC